MGCSELRMQSNTGALISAYTILEGFLPKPEALPRFARAMVIRLGFDIEGFRM